MTVKTPPYLAVGLIPALFNAAAWAQSEPDATAAALNPETVVVTATRSERDIADVPATTSVLTSEAIERQLARDIRDLVRYEPGVSVAGTGNRFGLGGFSIRGIGGNRVLTLVDGVRVADAFSFGPFLSASRNYVDIDSLKAFEIVRGPGSALYGSDAIGGIVAYRTKQARDYLDSENLYGGIKLGISGADASTVGTITLAGGSDRLSAVVLHTRRENAETENFGGRGGTGIRRELPDPLDRTANNTSIKLSFDANTRNQITLGAEFFDSETATDVLSNYGLVARGTLTQSQTAIDVVEREKLSLRYDFTPDDSALRRITARAYTQVSDQSQTTLESRMSLATGAATRRSRDSFFEQEIDGASLQAEIALASGEVRHRLIAGFDYWVTDSASLRAGGSVDAVTGAAVPEFLPLPTRDFPLTTIDQAGLYIQDEVRLLDGRLLLTPSLRFDDFDAVATADPIFQSGNPGQPAPESFKDSEVSPKLGMLYHLNDTIALYAQYAEGFKAPPYDDVNVGFSNPIGGYKTISNPALESERSKSTELGLRFSSDLGRLSIVAFRNDYQDFIESFLAAPQFAGSFGVDPADGLFTFQSQNLDRVKIDGIEVSGQIALSVDSPFSVKFSVATADGTDLTTGNPLNSIDPAKAVVGLNYTAANGRWGGDFVLTMVDRKSETDINPSDPRRTTSGYGTVDLLGYYHFAERIRLNFGLFNIGDKRYIEWADTAAITFDSATETFPEANRFTRPGFNAGMTLRVEF